MTYRPILFSGPMVRAILERRKTQTRRVMKSQPYTLRTEGFGYPMKAGGFVSITSPHCLAECPYGVPGDRLWVALEMPGCDERYCIDLEGKPWSCAKGSWRPMKASPTSKGYLSITPAVDGKYKTRLLHRLVAEAFYGQSSQMPEVRHLDGNQINNHPNNLDWGTVIQNRHDRCAHGKDSGEKHHSARLTAEQVKFIRRCSLSQRWLAKEFGVSQSTIQQARSGETWADDLVQEPPNFSRWIPDGLSRITLEITDVRVQRLQEITCADARAEGSHPLPRMDSFSGWHAASQMEKIGRDEEDGRYISPFISLWDSINAKRHPWAENPWVWALTFRRIDA